jgi:LytR cell envelope-related transcriptional attenuator
MALPSGFTLVSAAALVAAGVWLATSASGADQQAPGSNGSAGPAPHASPSHGSSTQGHRAAQPKPQPRPDAVPKVLVEVFNNSGVTGLAGSKAALLRGAGWNVAAVDNWHGDIPADTVYYPPQLRHAAHELAAVLHIRRLRPAVTPMEFDRLTVIYSRP